MNFGERLIKVRKEHGYTREALAQSLKISKYTLRNYELGATEPGHTFLKQISDFFHVSIDYLMGLTDEPEILETFSLNASEQTIIKKYRDLDEHGREMVDFTLNKEYERSIALTEEKESNVMKFPEHLMANAANAQNPTEVQKQHADSIMADDSEWK
ncbi:helix-turn-helix domain-containing protein [[Ruminococcus] torques]|uniref:helix-turn-helix domain-containing protein n=1 Tax=[Ruminococcus] torques TaxID=33039 RepID=UPI00265DAEC2|nr:helix-turn-helix transcriptional regulator [[Ruminococcus] torques]